MQKHIELMRVKDLAIDCLPPGYIDWSREHTGRREKGLKFIARGLHFVPYVHHIYKRVKLCSRVAFESLKEWVPALAGILSLLKSEATVSFVKKYPGYEKLCKLFKMV